MVRLFLSLILLITPCSILADSSNSDIFPVPTQAVQELISELGLRESDIASRDLAGWSPPQKIVIRGFQEGQLQALQAVAPGVEIVFVDSVEQAVIETADAQAMLGYCNEKILSKSPGLFWIQVYSSGVERCVMLPGMNEGNRLLTNGQRIGSPALAEHATAMMMVLARNLDVYHANQVNNGKWQWNTGLDRADHMELEGRTLLVVGLGGIGTQVAKRGHGLGMRVIATRRSRREGPEYVDYVGLSRELNQLASQADVVINAAPLTEQTRGMFNAEFFKAMKPTGYFISVGRGASTVTDDLVTALESGAIAGAGHHGLLSARIPQGALTEATIGCF
jgi:phosphoglycerate dehydrogenase-like enzyme